MRGQDHPGLRRFRKPVAGALLGGLLVFVCGAIYAQTAPQIVPRVTGAAAPMGMCRRRLWRGRSSTTSG